MMFIFFLNDTATTESHTYGHTRSLHSALPIWRRLPPQRQRSASRGRGPGLHPVRCRPPCPAGRTLGKRQAGAHFDSRPRHRTAREDPQLASQKRSEEHTSEIQSLMRHSYALFTLKKTNTINTQTNLHDN